MSETLAERVKRALAEGQRAPQLLIPGTNGGPVAVQNGQAAPQPGVSDLPLSQRVVYARSRAEQCLLLDCSGSMAEHVEPGRSKWQALAELLPQFGATKRYAFSSACVSCVSLPAPGGGTDMALAFETIKREGLRHAILITDGLPNDEDAALRAAVGLRLDILYVGPLPQPPFLARLAAATGGSAQPSSLKRTATPALTRAIRGLLAPGPKGGA